MQEARPLLLIIRKDISVSVLLARRILGNKIRSRVNIAFTMMFNGSYEVCELLFLAACEALATDLIFGLMREWQNPFLVQSFVLETHGRKLHRHHIRRGTSEHYQLGSIANSSDAYLQQPFYV